MGMVSPLGAGVTGCWEKLIAGKSGIQKIEHFEVSDISSQIAGVVPRSSEENPKDGAFNPDLFLAPKEQRKLDDFTIYAMAAAHEAVEDSGWKPTSDEDLECTGVIIGSGIGGLQTMNNTAITLLEQGPRRISPFANPAMLINIASGHVSIKYGFRGPNHAVVTACATGTHAIGDAGRMVALGDAEVMVAGGAEAGVNRLGVSSFAAVRALSTGYNDRPLEASRPFDEGRDGFVIAEGAGIVIVEEYEHAKKRGAKIYGEIIGYGMSGDAHHITAPASDGSGGRRAVEAALKRAGLGPEDIDYINAHGTSTPVGDGIECIAIKKLFGHALDKLCMSSTKSAIGHMLGAAGAVEAIFVLKAIETGMLPPTLNLEDVSEDCKGIDLIPGQAREKKVKTVLTNSFGFGGTNASLIMRAV